MAKSILSHKKLLIVDDEPDILAIVETEIHFLCPSCEIDMAATYEKARKLVVTKSYDLVILDIMGVRGFDLLKAAVQKKLKVVMLTAHALSAENLKKSYEMGAWGYLPKDQLGNLMPFLEDVLKTDRKTAWKHLLKKLGSVFDLHFEPEWEKKYPFHWD